MSEVLIDGRRLRQLARRMDRAGEAAAGPPMVYTVTAGPIRRLLFTTDPCPVMDLLEAAPRVMMGTAFFASPTLLDGPCTEMVAGESRRHEMDVLFLGDLSPHDLTMYLVLAAELKEYAVGARYLGIESELMDLCRRDLAGERKERGLATAAMTAGQRQAWGRLRDVGVQWDRLLGREALELLEAGEKFELESVVDPQMHRKDHLRRVARWVTDAASQARR